MDLRTIHYALDGNGIWHAVRQAHCDRVETLCRRAFDPDDVTEPSEVPDRRKICYGCLYEIQLAAVVPCQR